MALKSTVFKCSLGVADLDRHYYADHALTLARHPSETDARMMVRLLAFAFLADEGLQFCKGLSDVDEPALWRVALDGSIAQWVEVGLPEPRRLLRAGGRAREVVVFAYGGRAAELWWASAQAELARLAHLRVWFVPDDALAGLAGLVRRTMRLQATIQDGQALINGETVVSVAPELWRAPG